MLQVTLASRKAVPLGVTAWLKLSYGVSHVLGVPLLPRPPQQVSAIFPPQDSRHQPLLLLYFPCSVSEDSALLPDFTGGGAVFF